MAATFTFEEATKDSPKTFTFEEAANPPEVPDDSVDPNEPPSKTESFLKLGEYAPGLRSGRPHIKPEWIDPIEKQRAELGLPQVEDKGPFETIMRRAVEPVAAAVMNKILPKKAPVFTINFDGGKPGETVQMGQPRPAVIPGQPLLDFTPNPFTGEKGMGTRLAEGMSTPGQLLTLPAMLLAPEAKATKALEALYAGTMVENLPGSISEAVKTGDRKSIEDATAQVVMLGLMGRGLASRGKANARQVETPAEVHGDVRPQQTPAEELPTTESGGGVQPPAEAPKTQIPLSDEHAALLAPHFDEATRELANLPNERVMQANHETGKVEIDPTEFGKWVDNDLKGLNPKEKAAAVKSAFEHEDIHLKTDPEDGEPFWNSMSPFEQSVLKRNYLKGGADESPQNLGMEAIRNHIERAAGMTRNDFVGLALKERWTAKTLDALANVVGKIRRLRDKELSAHQKAILDKVLGNIESATVAVSPATKAEEQYAEGPFMRRQAEPEPEKEGMVRLYRGHEGAEGGVYWSKDKTYASRMGSQMEYLDVPADELPDHAVRNVEASGTPNAFKLPPEMTKAAKPLESEGVPIHNLDDIESPLPPTAPGERVVLVKRPDGSIYRAAYSGKQYDVSAGGKAMIDKYGGSMVDSIGTVNARGEWTHGLLPKGDKIIKGFSPYAAVERSGGPEAPAMRRKSDKGDIKQENLFTAPITQRGVPGEEPTAAEKPTAEALGAKHEPTEQKIFANQIDFDQNLRLKESDTPRQNMPFRQITESESKNPRELSDFLTEDARSGGSDLPVSFSKRLTVLFSKTDGRVHLVSTYRGDNVARMVDPDIAGKSRPNRPIGEILPRYKPIYSVLVKEPLQNFHQEFDSLADFYMKFGEEAKLTARETGTGFGGIPVTNTRVEELRSGESGDRSLVQASKPVYPEESEPNLPRPEQSELRAVHDFFGDELPSDRTMFENKLVKGAAKASRQMISGLVKMVDIERAQTRGLSEREALENVLDKLYENLTRSDTRSDFIERTLAQSRTHTPETDAAIQERLAEIRQQKASGARDLSTIRDRAPTTTLQPGQKLRRLGPSLSKEVPLNPPEKLSPEDQAALDAQIRKGHPPQFEVSPRTTLGKQVLETPVPKEPYTVGKSKSIEGINPETGEPYEGSDALEALEEQDRENAKQKEIFPEREVQSEAPAKPTKVESLAQEKKVVAKAEGSKGQLDFWKQQPPAMRRRAQETVDHLKDYLARTSANISTAGSLSDQLYRLKTGEKADYDLALPVIKSALKIIPEADRPKLLQYADEVQVLGKSGVKLTDAQQMMYDTFLKPLIDDNQKMFEDLRKAGVPVGESTYLGRIVQDTHSLYSRLWRGTKQRVTEGSILGQGASFFKRRVFKALEDSKGDRKMVAIVGSGDRAKIIGYTNGKAELMGAMAPDSIKAKPLTEQQIRSQRIVEARRLQELDKLDKENFALLKEQNRLEKMPQSADRDVRLKGVNDRLSSINSDYIEVENKYPTPQFDVPRLWVDKSGKLWKFTDATVGEIEKNTNTRYYKEPMSGVITQHLKLKQIYRANEFLTNLKNSPDFQRVSRSTNERNVPEDWRTVDLAQFRGLRIEPRTADVLDLFAAEQKGPSLPLKWVNNMTMFLRNALFVWDPFVHLPNLLNHWFTARGADWAKPMGYDRMFKSGVAAVTDVMTRSKFRDQALRAGAPLMRGMGKMNGEILNLLSKELDSNPSLGRKIARGLGYVNPIRMVRAFGDSLTWGTNEILTLQLIRETMGRTGLSMEDAIAEVGKHMPNYRIPPRVLNSRLIAHVMRNPLLSLWGHYHYGALKSYGEMGKEILSPSSTLGQRMDGLGRVATIGFLMAVFYPTMDKIINDILGSKGYKLRRAGSATAPSNILAVAQGKKSPSAALQSVVTPSPAMTIPAELVSNRNLRSGLPIYDRRLGLDTPKDLAKYAASQISPIQEADTVFGGKKSAKEFWLGEAGISHSRVDSAMSKFGRLADEWMKGNSDPVLREAYKRRSQDVFAQSDYQLLRSAVVRGDDRASVIMVDRLLKARHSDQTFEERAEEMASRIQSWKDSPFTGTRDGDEKMMQQMTPEQLNLWYEAAQERIDISNKMMMQLAERVAAGPPK